MLFYNITIFTKNDFVQVNTDWIEWGLTSLSTSKVLSSQSCFTCERNQVTRGNQGETFDLRN